MIHGISSIRFVACQSRNNFASTGRQGFKVVGGRVFTGTWFHSPVYLNISAKDGNVFRRQLLWKENNLTYFKSWNTARTSKAAPGFLASRGSTEGWSHGEVAAGGGSSTMVPSNSKAIFTGKEDRINWRFAEIYPYLWFFFFVDQVNFVRRIFENINLFLDDENRKMHLLKVDLYCKSFQIINIICFIFL